MRWSALLLAVFVLTAVSARADQAPPPEKFFSLSTPRHLPDGKVTVPLRGSAHFFPLAQKHKFFALPRHASRLAAMPPHLPASVVAAAAPAPMASAPAIAADAPAPDNHTGMTREEAHQILSLFSSTR